MQIEDERTILPCPSIDFNAAGLLYFPSFSALCDRAMFEAGTPARMIGSRHVVYLGNVEPGEPVQVGLKSMPGGKEAVLRGPDHRPLALMRVRFHD